MKVFLLFLFLVIPHSILAQQGLTIAATPSLNEALTEIANRYHAVHGGAMPVLTFGASNTLTMQILNEEGIDLFLTPSLEDIKILRDHNLVGPTRVVAQNQLILVVLSNGGLAPITKLQDLERPEVKRIAISDETKTLTGRYAKQSFQHVGIWDQLVPKLIRTQSPIQSMSYMYEGRAEVGFVYRSELPSPNITAQYVIPDSFHDPILYRALMMNHSHHRREVVAFTSFLLSPDAQGIFKKYHFLTPS